MLNAKDYEQLLELSAGWTVADVEHDDGKKRVTVKISCFQDMYRCPCCGLAAPLHDMRERSVRHLNFWNYQTFLEIKYPRTNCRNCGIKAIAPPFAAASKRFTNAFIRNVIRLCDKKPIRQVASDLKLHWNVVAKIKDDAFNMAQSRKALQSAIKKEKIYSISIDEKCYRGHDCVTVITNTFGGNVLAVLDGREAETVNNYFASQKLYDFSELISVCMDMARPYIKAIRDSFPNADDIICFDRFHVAQLFTRAVDGIRRRESKWFYDHKQENPLAKTRFEWLRNSSRTDNSTDGRKEFLKLAAANLDTAKAWVLKEQASLLWNYSSEAPAKKAWKKLLWKMSHSRIPELKKLYKTLKAHLRGILNAIKLRATNALAEARNSCIQRLRYAACGYRNKQRFMREIIFQMGGLDLTF